MRLVVAIAMVAASVASVATAQADAAWDRIGHRCETVLARSGDAQFRDVYLVCVFGLATEADRERGRAIGREVRDGVARAIRGIDEALGAGGTGKEHERDRWVRARASALPLAQARAGVLLLATLNDDAERAAIAREIVGLINATNPRDDAQEAEMRVLPASAALVLGEHATAVELYAQAMHVVSITSDRAMVLRAHGAEIALGSALSAARVGGAARGRDVLDRAMRDEPFVGTDGVNARLMLAGADAHARLDIEAGGVSAGAIDRICGVYTRLLRRSDLSHVRDVLRARVMERLGRIVPESFETDKLPTIGAFARTTRLLATRRRDEAMGVLVRVRARGETTGDDLSRCLVMQAACASEGESLRYLMEHVEILPSHERTTDVLHAGGRIARGVLVGDSTDDATRAQAKRCVRIIRDRHPECDPSGITRAALAMALSRDPEDVAALLEGAMTWGSIRGIQEIAGWAGAKEILSLIAAVCASDGEAKLDAAERLRDVCSASHGALAREREALVASGSTIAAHTLGDSAGCIDASDVLLGIGRIEPAGDTAAAAMALDARYSALAGLGDSEELARTVDLASDLLGAHAGGLVARASEDAWNGLVSRTGGFWGSGNAMDNGNVRILGACAAWGTLHGAGRQQIDALRHGAAVVHTGDGARATEILADAGGSAMALFARAETLLAGGDERGAFGAYRALAEHLDAAREYNDSYFKCWVRMLEILAARDDAPARAAEILDEADRLLGREEIKQLPECARRLRSVRDRFAGDRSGG